MSKTWLALIMFALLGVGLTLAGKLLLQRKAPITINSTPKNKSEQKLTENRPQKSKVSGWVAYWEEDLALTHLKGAIKRLEYLGPLFYKIQPDGSLGKREVENREQFLALARGNGIPLIPVVGDEFDFESVSLLLYDEKIQERFLLQLVEEARKENFSGWDINIESLKRNDREVFADFIKNAAEKLHNNNLTLSATLFARTENETFEGALAQDYSSIGQVADRVQLMVYNFHNDDTDPGGQAPIDWYREILAYALNEIPIEKIVIGLSTHGYDWGGVEVEPLNYSQVMDRIAIYKGVVDYDDEESSAYANYTYEKQEHVIWFENARSILEKMTIAQQEFGINKFILWRVGAEDPDFWEKLEKNQLL